MFDLSGKTALVTGASRGLGWEIALGFASKGAVVHVNGRNREHLDQKINDTGKTVGQLHAAAFDVCDTTSVDDWFQANSGALDILVNNVGLRHRKTVRDCPPEDFARVLDVNLVAPYRMARLASTVMNPGGGIINITSIAGPRSRSGDAAYTAAKGGLEALTRALAMELAPGNIRVNAIAPGFFATEANAAMIEDPAIKSFVDTRIPFKRWGRPDEIAGAAVYLASDASSYVNAHVLTVDGGLSASF